MDYKDVEKFSFLPRQLKYFVGIFIFSMLVSVKPRESLRQITRRFLFFFRWLLLMLVSRYMNFGYITPFISHRILCIYCQLPFSYPYLIPTSYAHNKIKLCFYTCVGIFQSHPQLGLKEVYVWMVSSLLLPFQWLDWLNFLDDILFLSFENSFAENITILSLLLLSFWVQSLLTILANTLPPLPVYLI